MGFRPDVRPAGRPDQRSGDVEAAVLPAPVVLTGHALLRTRPCLGLRTWKRFKPKASTFKTHLVGFYYCQKSVHCCNIHLWWERRWSFIFWHDDTVETV